MMTDTANAFPRNSPANAAPRSLFIHKLRRRRPFTLEVAHRTAVVFVFERNRFTKFQIVLFCLGMNLKRTFLDLSRLKKGTTGGVFGHLFFQVGSLGTYFILCGVFGSFSLLNIQNMPPKNCETHTPRCIEIRPHLRPPEADKTGRAT